jgi:hypothetical protein
MGSEVVTFSVVCSFSTGFSATFSTAIPAKKKTQQKINVIRILGDKIAHSGGPLAKNVPVSLSTMGSWLAGAGEATGEWVVGALEPGVDFKLPGGVRGASSLHW